MKKLEDIPKQNIFEVPEGYFDKLPSVIQARIAKPEPAFWQLPVFKYALSIASLFLVGIIWWNSQTASSLEDQLSQIQTEQLLAYLETSEISTEYLADEIDITEIDLDVLEESVFSSMDFSESDLEEMADELIIESENL
jgi:hypothetical protein